MIKCYEPENGAGGDNYMCVRCALLPLPLQNNATGYESTPLRLIYMAMNLDEEADTTEETRGCCCC
eukprot:COSAG05_NODE_1251_length_5381_cov_82.840591_6_plen_66_part_00